MKRCNLKMADNNSLKIFENEQFGQIRTVTINDEIWFVLKDVRTVFDISNPSNGSL